MKNRNLKNKILYSLLHPKRFVRFQHWGLVLKQIRIVQLLWQAFLGWQVCVVLCCMGKKEKEKEKKKK